MQHISTIAINGRDALAGTFTIKFEPDGICHCDNPPLSSPIGECPRCHRLDLAKSFHIRP